MTHLLVTNDFPPKMGGIQNYLWELWRRLPEGRARVLTTTHPNAASFDAAQPFPIERADRVLLPTPRVLRRVQRAARDAAAELTLFDPVLPIGLLARRVGRPYGVIVHGAELAIPARAPGGREAVRAILRGARLIVAAGPYVAAEASAIAPDVDVVDIPPGVDGDAFLPSTPAQRRATRARLGITEDAEVVLHLSRLVPRKGADTMIKAVAELAKRRPKIIGLVAGAGRDEKRLRALAAGLHAPIRFLGRVPQDEIVALYGAADVFAHLCRSRWGGLEQEGFGIIFLEAAACGVPQIAGKSGGSADAVLDGVTGRVVDPPTDARAAARAIEGYLANPTLTADVGHAARQRALLDFAYDDLATKLDNALLKAEQA